MLPTKGNVRPLPSELARTLTSICTEGALSTVSSEGWPVTTLVQFTIDPEGRPVLRLPRDSNHFESLSTDNKCSLHVQVSPWAFF